MRHVSLVQEYFHPWPNSAGFHLARELGLYAERDIDLELRTVDHARGDGLEHLIRGDVHFAVVPTNRLLVRREAGHPVVAIRAINQRGLETLRTRADSGITRPRDLAGRRIALNPTPRGLAVVHDIVARDGGDPSSVTIVDAGARELDPVDGFGGLADATFGSYWSWDILLSPIEPALDRWWPVDELLGVNYHSYVLATTQAVLQHDPGLVHDVLAATEAGFVAAARDLDQTAELFERVTPYFAPAVIRRSLEAIAPTWFVDGRWGQLRRSHIEPYAQWLAGHGILSHAAVWHSAVPDAAIDAPVGQNQAS